MSDIEDFELTDGEKHHPLWLRLKAHFETQLQVRRVRNDRIDATPDQTAAIRGEIRILKALIGLGSDRPLTGD